MGRIITATLLALIVCEPAWAKGEAKRSDFWLKRCSGEPQQICYAYLRGGVDGMMMMISMMVGKEGETDVELEAKIKSYGECLDPRITTTQSIKVWMRYLERHPEEHHLPGILTYHRAIDEVFGCD